MAEAPKGKGEKACFLPQNSSLDQSEDLTISPENQEKEDPITFPAVLAVTFQLLMVIPQPAGSDLPHCRAWTWLPYLHAKGPGMMALVHLTRGMWTQLGGQRKNL